MPGEFDFVVYQNTTFLETVEWRDSNGVTIDLRDYTGLMEVRDKAGGTLVATLSTANSGIVSRDDKRMDLFLTDTLTRPIPAGVYRYDLLVANTSTHRVTPLLAGRFTVKATVTQGDATP